MRFVQRSTIIGAVLLMAAIAGAKLPAREPTKRVVKFLGDSTVAVLQGAEKVEVFRLENAKAKAADPSIGGYAISATGKAQDTAFGKQLAGVLLDDGTYLWDSAKGCKFDPGVGYRVWKGDRAVDIVICFKCDILIVVSPKGADGSQASAGEDFDAARAAMVKLAKAAFPEDEEIQGLAEKG